MGIRVCVIDPRIVDAGSIGNASVLAQVVKGLKRHKVGKHLYYPLRGIPNARHCFSVSGNHRRALFGEGDTAAHPSECFVLDDGKLHKAGHEILDNLGKCLLIEANVYIHKQRRMPNIQRERRGPAATDIRMQTELNGWPLSAARCGWTSS